MNESSSKLLKPFRKEVKSLFKSVASKVWLVLALDPKFEEELARFKLLAPLRKHFDSMQSGERLTRNPDETAMLLSKIGQGSVLRLRAIRKELKDQLCLLCEKAILLSTIDKEFAKVIEDFGFSDALEFNVRWHATSSENTSDLWAISKSDNLSDSTFTLSESGEVSFSHQAISQIEDGLGQQLVEETTRGGNSARHPIYGSKKTYCCTMSDNGVPKKQQQFRCYSWQAPIFCARMANNNGYNSGSVSRGDCEGLGPED